MRYNQFDLPIFRIRKLKKTIGISFVMLGMAPQNNWAQTTLSGNHIITGNLQIGTSGTKESLTVTGSAAFEGNTVLQENLVHSGTGTFNLQKGSANFSITPLDEYGESGNSISINAGAGSLGGGSVVIAGAGGSDSGGSVSISGGNGDGTAGQIAFNSGSSYLNEGAKIQLTTGSGATHGGDILLMTGGGNEESTSSTTSGNIIIHATGSAPGGFGKVELKGAKIDLKGSISMERQGDIPMGEFGNP